MKWKQKFWPWSLFSLAWNHDHFYVMSIFFCPVKLLSMILSMFIDNCFTSLLYIFKIFYDVDFRDCKENLLI